MSIQTQNLPTLAPIVKLGKDVIAAIRAGSTRATDAGSAGIGPGGYANHHEARVLVDLYYTTQEMRKRLANQVLAVERGVDAGESHEMADFLLAQVTTIEDNARAWLGTYAAQHALWPWFAAVHGIGPVLAAGLIAHLGCKPVPQTVGHWWRFAGLDPNQKWNSSAEIAKDWAALEGSVEERARVLAVRYGRRQETVIRDATTNYKTGEEKQLTKATAIASLARIPYNRPLKTLCWKIGDSFMHLGDRQDAFYARLYRERKAIEVERNMSGGRAGLAATTLAAKPNHADKESYQAGQLPKGRVDLMARRWTVKIFLSHLHHVWWMLENGTEPPVPYAIGVRQHAHYIRPPYLHVLFGEQKAA